MIRSDDGDVRKLPVRRWLGGRHADASNGYGAPQVCVPGLHLAPDEPDAVACTLLAA